MSFLFLELSFVLVLWIWQERLRIMGRRGVVITRNYDFSTYNGFLYYAKLHGDAQSKLNELQS